MPRVNPEHISEIQENTHKIRRSQRDLHEKIKSHEEQHTRFEQRIDNLNSELQRHRNRFFWLLGGIGTTLITTLTILLQTLLGGAL